MPAAVERLRLEDENELTTHYRITSVWNGNQKAGGTAFSVSLSVDAGNPICVFNIEFTDVEALRDASNLQQLMRSLLEIWPAASIIEAGALGVLHLPVGISQETRGRLDALPRADRLCHASAGSG